MKSSGAAWQNILAGTFCDLGFKSSLADPDVWMRPAIHHGKYYYEYSFVCVDDLLVLSTDPLKIMTPLSKIYHLKEGSNGKPKLYLGMQN